MKMGLPRTKIHLCFQFVYDKEINVGSFLLFNQISSALSLVSISFAMSVIISAVIILPFFLQIEEFNLQVNFKRI